MKNKIYRKGGFGISEECDENLFCIPFSKEQLEEIKKYAALNGMEVEDFIKDVCLTYCFQHMESLYGQKPEEPETMAGAAKPENEFKIEPKEVEIKSKKPVSKELLDGPLVLDPQCIMDLFAIKRELGITSNNQIITIALKLGLNQLNMTLDLVKYSPKEKK